MRKELEEKLIDIKKRINEAILLLRITEKESELDLLETQTNDPNFWSDTETAKEIMQKLNTLRAVVQPWRELENEATELLELVESTEEGDTLLQEIVPKATTLEEVLKTKEIETYFSGKYDSLPAVLSIYAGAGGVDAQDWAEMLMGMFLKYAEKESLETKIIHITPGGEAGIKSVTIEVRGVYPYGKFKSERGVHRLVRISPYDSDKARHTSFALVEIIPEIEADDIEIDEKDLKIDTFRASGHGGQGVNTTDSAVRITHIPTKLSVSVQNERSQLQNKNTALKILKSRIKAFQEGEREEELKIVRGENLSAEWGSQIRSYVIHPYNMVKDHRTGYETSNTESVLSGNIKEFVEAYLKNQKM